MPEDIANDKLRLFQVIRPLGNKQLSEPISIPMNDVDLAPSIAKAPPS